MYVLTATDLDDIFESVPAVLISITFSSKIVGMMLNSKHVSNHYIRMRRNFLYKNY